MVAFGHTAVGTLVGLGTYHYFGNSDPALGLLTAGAAGVVSHYVADFVPHGHFLRLDQFKSLIYLEIIFNLFLSILIFLGIAYLQGGFDLKFWYVLFGIGGSQLPDVLDGLIYSDFLPKKGLIKLENDFHQATHWHAIHKKGKLAEGLPWKFNRDIWQILVTILALWVLLKS